jgi:hypothetical protein
VETTHGVLAIGDFHFHLLTVARALMGFYRDLEMARAVQVKEK